MNRSLATAVVEAHYPSQSVTDIEPREAGHRPTAVVRFAAHPPLVVQFSEAIDAVRTEATLVSAIRDRTDIPVPPVVATGTVDGQAYALCEFRAGRDLHTAFADSPPAVRRDIARAFGRYLGQLHASFPFGACGRVVASSRSADETGLVTVDAATDHWFVEYGTRAIARLPEEFDPLAPRLRDCVAEAADQTATPRLFPWDLRPGNALVDGATLTAILDWERPMAGPPALSLAKAAYLVADWYVDDPEPLRAAVRAGYERERSLPTVRPAHRVVAIADSAVDSRGAVTNPGYPELCREDAIAVHRAALETAVGGCNRHDEGATR